MCIIYIEKMNFLRSITKPSIRIDGIPGTCTVLEENIPCENYTVDTTGDCALLECKMYSDSRNVHGDKTFLYPMADLTKLRETNAYNRNMASATRRWGGAKNAAPNAQPKDEEPVVASNTPISE